MAHWPLVKHVKFHNFISQFYSHKSSASHAFTYLISFSPSIVISNKDWVVGLPKVFRGRGNKYISERKKKEKRENPEKIKRSDPRPTPFLTMSLRIQENKFENNVLRKMISYSPFVYLCLLNADWNK